MSFARPSSSLLIIWLFDKITDRVYDISMARYDGPRKLARNKALREYALANPDLSLQEIGEVFGISQSRVWRIIHGNQKSRKKNKEL